MEGLFTIENLTTLVMLILLQAVLGFDNLLYLSIESKRVAPEHQARVRRAGIGIAIVLRIVLLFVVMQAIDLFQSPLFSIGWIGYLEGAITGHSLIVLVGGVFIIYTAIKEIHHMLSVEDLEATDGSARRSIGGALFWIVLMNLVFSFDSVLSAIALTKVFAVMAVAIVISGVMMVWLADYVSEFLKRNRMYEVLGLFVLLLVGALLLSEGGHLAHLKLFGFAIEPMAKSTFYFVLFVLVAVDVVQGRYQKKLMAQKRAEIAKHGAEAE